MVVVSQIICMVDGVLGGSLMLHAWLSLLFECLFVCLFAE
jgi:hypothetical protein